jgi:hypothetical protein
MGLSCSGPEQVQGNFYCKRILKNSSAQRSPRTGLTERTPFFSVLLL